MITRRDAARAALAVLALLIVVLGFTMAITRKVKAEGVYVNEVTAAIKQQRSLKALASDVARKQGVPEAVAFALVKRESNWNPRAIGKAGEVGLVQIKYQTARALGFRGTRQQLFDPLTNLTYGFKYAAMALNAGSIKYYQSGIPHRKRLARRCCAL